MRTAKVAGPHAQAHVPPPPPHACTSKRTQVMGEDGNLRPMVFEDFCNHPSAKTAKLGAAAVLAIRLYSTAAFKSLNNPLRDADRTEAHPFYATIFFLTDGIRKLRAVEASKVKDKGDGKPRDQGVRFEGSSKGGASGKARQCVKLELNTRPRPATLAILG